jgi:hypothetical protein
MMRRRSSIKRSAALASEGRNDGVVTLPLLLINCAGAGKGNSAGGEKGAGRELAVFKAVAHPAGYPGI